MANKYINYLRKIKFSQKFFENRKSIAVAFLIFISLMVSCSPMRNKAQSVVEKWNLLSNDMSIGQTFVAEYDGLTGIQVYLEPIGKDISEIILEIKPQPDAELTLSRSSRNLTEITKPGFYEFNFPPISNSSGEYYYAKFSISGKGNVNFGSSSASAYLNGALHVNDQPQDLQMAFNLIYDSGWSYLGVVKEVVTWVKYLLAAILLFVLPGWGLLSVLWSGWQGASSIDRFLLSAGIAVAIYPIIFLWSDLFGWHPGSLFAWIPMMVSILIIIWRNHKPGSLIKLKKGLWSDIKIDFPAVCFLIVSGLILITRFWILKWLDVPMWGDSYHHTMISQLLVDNAGLFESWQPYADLSSFTYHFGFHASAAVFHWITGLQLSECVLWVGQIFNVLVVLVLFPLATRLGKSRWAGFVAVLVSGLLIQLPMVYTDWGRYTQLVGQVILPVLMYFVLDLTEEKGIHWKSLVINAVLVAGIALSHYRVLFFALFFMLTVLLFYLKRNTLKTLLIKIASIGLGSFFLFLPWFIRVYGSTILQIFKNQITTAPGALPQSAAAYNTIGNLTIYLPIWTWIFVGLAAIVGLLLRHRSMLMILVWLFLLLLGTNPNWIGLPGTGALSNFALFIAVYIPAGLIVGVTGGAIIDKILELNNLPKFSITFGIVLLIFTFSLLGSLRRINDIKPETYALAVRPDIRAAEWIRDSLPDQAKFLVNSFLAYDGTLAVGSDGGLWLPLLAGRGTTLPPITYGFERSTSADYIQSTNQLIAMQLSLGPTNNELIKELKKQNITHVYIGQRQGRVNYSDPGTLNPEELAADPHYQIVYHQDLVWIFRLIP